MLDRQSLDHHCLTKKQVTKEYPFDQTTAVFKVAGKMFMLYNDDDQALSFNVKCDPEFAIDLRRTYPAITAGYHMNKKHWNTIAVDGTIDSKELLALIDDSYDLVIAGLPKKLQAELKS